MGKLSGRSGCGTGCSRGRPRPGRVPEDGWIVFVNTVDGDGEGIGVEVVCVDKR